MDTASPPARWLSALRSRPYSVATTAILLGYLASYVLSEFSPWDHIYVQASRRLWAGEDFYRFEDGFAYPPCKALFMLPFLALPTAGQRVAWWACNALCLVYLCRGAWRLGGGTALETTPARPWYEHAIWLAGLATGIFYAFNSLSNQATDVVESALLVAGCLALAANRDLRAATCFGLAAAMKATPLLWGAYLVWKGRWRAAGWLAVVAVGVNFLPDLVSPCPTAPTWLAGWHQQYLAPLEKKDYTPGTWGSAVYYNQSFAGAANRLFVSEYAWVDGNMAVQRQADAPDAGTLKLATLAVEGLLVAACVLGWWRRGRSESGSAMLSVQATLEYSMVFILMLLLSPMSSKSHFTILLVPGFALARVAWERQSWSLGALFVAANVIGALALNWWGKHVALVSLYYGAVSIKALLLLAGCCVALTLLRRQTATAEAPSVQPRLAA